MAVERITVPLGGGLVASTSAENDTVALCPAATVIKPLPGVPQTSEAPATQVGLPHPSV